MSGTRLQVTRSIWQDTRSMISTSTAAGQRPTPADRSQPATKAEAEQEAERWVAEMMFDHYNG